MMIQKLFLIGVLAAMMCACSMGKNEQDNSPDPASVVTRVQEIYSDVFKQYNEFDQQRSDMPREKNDSLYCSADWNRWIARVDSDSRQNGGIGFMEADYWIMGQDWDELSVSDINVTSMTDSIATVELNLHNLGNVIPVRLDMIFENGAWKIDNFMDVKNDFDWKTRMKEYLTQEKAQ